MIDFCGFISVVSFKDSKFSLFFFFAIFKNSQDNLWLL